METKNTDLDRLIAQLREAGVVLVVKDGSLAVSKSGGGLTTELREFVKSNKDALINLLSAPKKGEGIRIQPTDTNTSGEYPVSSQQRRMFTLQQIEPESCAYNETQVFQLESKVELHLVQRTIDRIASRHESLRTHFRLNEIGMVQVVSDRAQIVVENLKCESSDLDHVLSSLRKPFDLENGPLARVALLSVSNEKQILFLDLHHSISDGVSGTLMAREFLLELQGQAIAAPAVQYRDYASWQQAGDGRQILEQQEAYWLKQFESLPEELRLPLDERRGRTRDAAGASYQVLVSQDQTERWGRFCKTEGITEYMLYLAAYHIALSRYSGSDDIVTGCPVAGRDIPELEGCIGMFVNTLALRSNPKGDKTVREYLDEVKTVCLEGFRNQQFPFEALVEKLPLNRDLNRNPLFDAVLVLQNFNRDNAKSNAIGAKAIGTSQSDSKFDLSAIFIPSPRDGLMLRFEYAKSLFREETIRRLADVLVATVDALVVGSEQLIGYLDCVPAKQRDRLLNELAGTAKRFAPYESVVEVFQERVREDPNATALQLHDLEMSYGELDACSDVLAAMLQSRLDLAKGDRVAIALSKSFEQLVSILAVLKAGFAFVPIDLNQPTERIRYLIEDSGSKICILDTNTELESVTGCELLRINLENLRDVGIPYSESRTFSADDLAYVIYTSGSTGKPKGVLIESRGLLNLCFAQIETFEIDRGSRVLQFASPIFDASISEIFTALCSGATLVIPPEDILDNLEYIRDQSVTVATLTPSLLGAVSDGILSGLSTLVTAGEDCPLALAQRCSALVPRFINAYGPTENTVCTSMGVFDAIDREVTIGTPMPNQRIYILDTEQRLLPQGAIGELCVSGHGLARGYLNKPEQTAKSFIKNPFGGGDRLYRTGDLARLRYDGRLEFLGRVDRQVKIRGMRVELGEIESAIRSIAGIRDAAVVFREGQNGNRLVAYYCVEKDVVIEAQTIQQTLQSQLAKHMIPDAFVFLERIPTTTNGKLDTSLLPEAPLVETDREVIQPRNEIEQSLVKIWSGVLGIEKDQISVTDDFFNLGGDSLLAVKAVGKAKWEGLDLSVKQMIETPTIEALAAVSTNHQVCFQSGRGSQPTRVPLAAGQMEYFYRYYREKYIIAMRFEVRFPLDPTHARTAIHFMLGYHEGLRSHFIKDEQGKWGAHILNYDQLDLDQVFEYVDLGSSSGAETVIDREWQTKRKDIDPESGKNLCVTLYERGEGKPQRLQILISHLVCDGASVGILMDDFIKLYQQAATGTALWLPPKTASVLEAYTPLYEANFAENTLNELNFWKSRRWEHVKPIPFEFGADESQNLYSSHHYVESFLDRGTTQELIEGLAKADIALSDAVFWAYAEAVLDWTGGEVMQSLSMDARGALAAFGPEVDYSRTVGLFGSSRMFVIERPKGTLMLDRLNEVIRAMQLHPNGGLGFELLCNRAAESGEDRELLGFAKQKLLFNYFGFMNTSDKGALDAVTNRNGEKSHSDDFDTQHDCTFHLPILVLDGQLRLCTDYSVNLFQEKTILAFFERILTNLRRLKSELRQEALSKSL